MPDIEKLRALKELFDEGVLTQEEFSAAKQEVLSASNEDGGEPDDPADSFEEGDSDSGLADGSDGDEWPPSQAQVVLFSAGPRKIAVIKVVKDLFGLGFRASKELVDRAPSVLPWTPDAHVRAEAISQLTGAGATVRLEIGDAHREFEPTDALLSGSETGDDHGDHGSPGGLATHFWLVILSSVVMPSFAAFSWWLDGGGKWGRLVQLAFGERPHESEYVERLLIIAVMGGFAWLVILPFILKWSSAAVAPQVPAMFICLVYGMLMYGYSQMRHCPLDSVMKGKEGVMTICSNSEDEIRRVTVWNQQRGHKAFDVEYKNGKVVGSPACWNEYGFPVDCPEDVSEWVR